MFHRALRHPKSGERRSVAVNGDYFEKFEGHQGRAGSLGTPERAMAEGLKELKKWQKQGFVETEASISFRYFTNSEGDDVRFWSIQLLDGACHFRMGRGAGYGPYDVEPKKKFFVSDAEARAEYDRQIARKLREGYVEPNPRKTAYSTPIQSLEASPARTSKPAAPKKPTPATRRSSRSAPPTAAAEPPPPAPKVVTDVTHRIELDPRDWFLALWRDPDPLPPPELRLFDLDAALEAIRRAGDKVWRRIQDNLPDVLSHEEALFRAEAAFAASKERNPVKLAERLKNLDLRGSIDAKKLRRMEGSYELVTACAAALLSPVEYVDFLIGIEASGAARDVIRVLPYLSRAERKRLRDHVAKRANAAPTKRSNAHIPRPEHCLAGALGCHDVVEALLKKASRGDRVLPLIFGLGSAERVIAEADRLDQWRSHSVWYHWDDVECRAWLAHTEVRRLDVLVERSLATRRDFAEPPVKTLALVKDPAAAVALLKCRQAGRGGEIASAWLDEQVGNAVAGVVAIAANGRDPLAKPALDYLRTKKRQGFAAVIEKALRGRPAAVVERIRADVLDYEEPGRFTFDAKSSPRWLATGVAAASSRLPLKGSGFAKADALPPLVVGDHRLSAEQAETVLVALQHSELGKPLPLVKHLRENATPESRDAFSWALFDAWIANAAPPAQKWAMRSLGHFGTDATAIRLAPLVRAWPGESQHPRAVLGLDCLRAIGTSGALRQLASIGQKLKFKALQRKAVESVEAIAAELGMTKDELEDRVVSDCGLDENGSCVFDFGQRKFTFTFDPDLKPAVRDGDGALRRDLPKPSSKDDEAKSKQALAAWGELKKQLRDALKLQSLRLEQALVTGRRWPTEDFRTVLVEHPLLRHVTQRLLWCGFDATGKRLAAFRVTEEGDAADVRDEPAPLDKIASIGLIHPLHLTADERAKWGEMFSDYELIPPFPQLGRPAYPLTADEAKGTEIRRFRERKVAAAKLVHTLERLGWARGPAQDNGEFREHYKPFRMFNLTAIVTYDGLTHGDIARHDDQAITGCFFIAGLYAPKGWPRHKPADKLRLGAIDPVVVSETITDLSQVAGQSG